jgi:lipoate-protein ligase A
MEKKFRFITHNNHDPYFNLASEEYLLKQKDGFYLYLWINAPSVIVGVNQNAFKEVNLNYTENNGIKVVRRLTGGGAVYHDLKNVNYTVIAPYHESENLYKEFSTPVIEYLKSLGLNAEFSGRNDILVDGKKISGNAQTVFNGRVMHHGTLLFDTDTSVLSSALNPSKLKMESKGIKSVRSRVTNIKDCLKNPLTVTDFLDGLKRVFLKNAVEYEFNQQDINAINNLVKEKYSTYEWNIGRSPKGSMLFEQRFDFGILTLSFDVKQGVIENANIHGDFFSKKDVNELAFKLNGVKFEKQSLLNALEDISIYIVGANANDIVEKMFE